MFFVQLITSVVALAGSALAGGSFTYERLDRDKAAVAIIDHQVGLFHAVRDFEPSYFLQQVKLHAEIAKAWDLPVILTTSVQNGPNGPLFKDVADMFPDAPFIERKGEVNAMDSPEFFEALAGLNRSQVIVAGIQTDVCTAFAALSMREEGYSVWANTEASGTISALVRDGANDRMRDAGVHIVSPFAIWGELLRDHRQQPEDFDAWPFYERMQAASGVIARSHGAAVTSGELVEGQDSLSW